MNQPIKVIAISIIFGAVAGALVSFAVLETAKKPSTDEERIKDFYLTENTVHVSPHGIRKKMSQGLTDNFILVDLRSQEEYEKEHIVTAVNIPAYKDPNTSAYGDAVKSQAFPKFKSSQHPVGKESLAAE